MNTIFCENEFCEAEATEKVPVSHKILVIRLGDSALRALTPTSLESSMDV